MTLLTVANDRTAILKDLRFYITQPLVNENVRVELAGASPGTAVVIMTFVARQGNIASLMPYIVLEDADQVVFRNTGSLAVEGYFWISGSLLLGDPT